MQMVFPSGSVPVVVFVPQGPQITRTQQTETPREECFLPSV